MSETTRISWTDATWNPWIGCRKVSSGCKNCYAETLVENRMGRDFRQVHETKWRGKPKQDPRRWPGRKRIFTCSLSDFFIEEADAWREEAWRVIHSTPYHTYQILTKRPERIQECLPDDWGLGYPNVWLGTSVESQAYQDRIAALLRIEARVHFVSCEPLLGPLTLEPWFQHYVEGFKPWPRVLEWVIVGGESGPGFRPMEEEWALELRDECWDSDTPFFFKQHSGPHSEMEPALGGREYREMPKAWIEEREKGVSPGTAEGNHEKQ